MTDAGGADAPGEVGAPIDLAALARGADGAAAVPGTELRVLAVREPRPLDPDVPSTGGGTWLLLLEGALLVDLPFGDFRELAPGQALEIPAGTEASLAPIDPSVVLIARRG